MLILLLCVASPNLVGYFTDMYCFSGFLAYNIDRVAFVTDSMPFVSDSSCLITDSVPDVTVSVAFFYPIDN